MKSFLVTLGFEYKEFVTEKHVIAPSLEDAANIVIVECLHAYYSEHSLPVLNEYFILEAEGKNFDRQFALAIRKTAEEPEEYAFIHVLIDQDEEQLKAIVRKRAQYPIN